MSKDINTRIGLIIEKLDIKKVAFASRLKIDQSYVTQLTNGKRNPSDRLISDICREFNVNENWLRTGKGKMFITQTRAEEIESFVKEILQEDSDFRRRVISVLARMTPDEWELVERKAREIFEETKKASTTPVQDAEEAYIKNFGSARNEESTALNSTADIPNDAGGMVG